MASRVAIAKRAADKYGNLIAKKIAMATVTEMRSEEIGEITKSTAPKIIRKEVAVTNLGSQCLLWIHRINVAS
jgi:hypothetical protein